jgi:hypothetical protein
MSVAIAWDAFGWDVPTTDPVTGFTSRGFVLSAELWRATIDNDLVEDISAYVVSGAVDMNVDRDIKLALNVTLRNPSMVEPYTDFLAPFIRLTYDDGTDEVYQQVGLYATKVAPGQFTVTDAVGTVQGDDLTSVLASYYYANGSTNVAGGNYATYIRLACSNGGIDRTNIPDTTQTLPADQSFEIGASRLEKINTYLDQLGWYHLGMDLDGKVSTPGPPQDLASKEPWRTLTDEDVMSVIDVTPSGVPIANVVMVVNDDATAAPLHSTARNDDPSSPTSTVAIGRPIMRVVKVTGSTTQAALDASAARYLAEGRTQYRTCKLTILHDPTALALHQTVRLALTGEQEAFSGLWWVRTASVGFTPDSPTVLEINQITDSLNGVSI